MPRADKGTKQPEPAHTLVGEKAQPSGKESGRFLAIKLRLTYSSAIALLGISPRKTKTLGSYENLYVNTHISLICKNQSLETTQLSFNKRLNKSTVCSIGWNSTEQSKGMN